jgi:hypothetical protein
VSRKKGVCKFPQTVILNVVVQVGEVKLTLGSSDARRSRSLADVPSPGSKSIGSRKYKVQRICRHLHCKRVV